MLSNILDRISFWALFVTVVLLPIFFLPFTKIPVEISKSLLLVVGLSISIIFWTVARFSDGKIVLPKSWLLLSSFGIVLAFLISALFSPALKVSFFGTMLDSGTFYFILATFLIMLFSAITFRDFKYARVLLFGSILSATLLVVFQVFRLFFPHFLSLGVLSANTDNLLGSWNTFGVFAGFLSVISLFVIEFFIISKIRKIFLGVLLFLSLFFVVLVNFTAIWVILGVFALIIFVYKVSFSAGTVNSEQKRSFPAFSFVVIMLSLLFLIAGQFIGGFLPNHFGVSNFEIRPSFSATMSVAKATLLKNPIVGAGPNRFAEMWALHKPAVVNLSSFWNSSFDAGSGLLPTFIVTTGGLGILAWLSFLVLLLLSGARALFIGQKKNLLNLEIILFFIMSLYLFTTSFFYSVGPVIFLLAFIFLGVFLGLVGNENKKEIKMSFLDDPRKSFFSILILILIMLVAASACFKYIEYFASVSYFQKTFSASSVDNAETSINKTVSLYSNDLYLRTYTQVYLLKVDSLASKSSLSESDKTDLKNSFTEAMNSAELAESYDPTNFLNYESLGSVYTAGILLGVSGSYDQAVLAYQKASSLSPLDPSIKLELARLAFQNKDVTGAKNYANQALSLKGDYIDALVVLSQIAKSEGNNTDALSYAEIALSYSPNDASLLQYVNSLQNNSAPAPTQATNTTSKTTTKTTTKK